MKKKMIRLLAAAALLAFTCTGALAADDGLKVLVAKDYQDKVTCEVGVANRITLTYTGASNGRQYLVTAQADGGETAAPTEDNLIYIDQTAAASGQVSYTIAPKNVQSDQTYSIYLSSNADDIPEYTQVATFGIGLKDDDLSSVVPGDVDENGSVTAADAAMVLDFAVKNAEPDERQFKASDVDENGTITAADAAQILDFAVKNITAFQKADT
ncbi:MAG: dockerin type I repeat-containing protein [Oscillibacter sp.]|nr:dockerin type I repeat-containing protein [Oscillibacter sp.]